MIHDTTQQLNGEVKLATQYPAESGHWYDPKTGSQVELPPRTWAKTAIKRGLVPGVTSITRLVARGALERWKINRAIALTLTELETWPQDGWAAEDTIIAAVWERLDAESEAITGRGKELHAAIEQFACGDKFDDKWVTHVKNVAFILSELGIQLDDGSSEHSFATERYGGKVDWHNDTWLLDFKTKDRLTDDSGQHDTHCIGKLKKLAYPEHAQQLAAYEEGINDNIELLRCANVFIGVEDAAVHIHEWTDEELRKGWRKFWHLLDYWWEDKQP